MKAAPTDAAFSIRLEGANLHAADLTDGGFERAVLARCNLSLVTAAGANFDGADFSNAQVVGTRFDDVSLRGARFHHAVLDSVSLSGADCTGASFAGATLANIDLSSARVDDADMTDVRVIEEA